MLGHFLKIISFYLLYKAIIETSLVSPWNLLYRDLKQSEKRLRQARNLAERSAAELEIRVKERTAELERVNRDLTDFNYIAAHDLQEPLRLLLTLGDRLSSTCEKCPDKKGQYFIDRIQGLARRASAFIRDIHKYSTISSRQGQFRPTDLNRVVMETLSGFDDQIKQTGAVIEVGDLPSLEVDPAQISEVFSALVSNALKFTNNEKPRISITGEEIDDGRQYRIMVKDNGLGFDEAYLEKIFTPFQRLHGLARFEGSGIGLALCRKVLERHGGSITARSEPDRGSTFIVTLPLDRVKRGMSR